MWTTFVTELKATLRNPSTLFWIIAFPLILSSIIQAVFGSVARSTVLETAPVAVVTDDAWRDSYGAESFVKALSGASDDVNGSTIAPSAAGATSGVAHTHAAAPTGQSSKSLPLLISRTDVSDTTAAQSLLRTGDVLAYLSVDTDGRLTMTLSQKAAADIAQARISGSDGQAWSLTTLATLIGQYNERSAIIMEAISSAAQTDPTKLNDPAWFTALLSDGNAESMAAPYPGVRTSTPMARYHIAILAMALMTAMSLTCDSITRLQANLSPLGARISSSPLSHGAKIASILLSSWLMTSICGLVDLLFIRFVIGVSFAGRGILAAAAVIIAAGTSSCLGLALGAIPRVTLNAKIGISIIVTLALSAFTGLYGNMSFADSVNRAAPALQYLNPVKQVTNLFYAIVCYDNLAPFLRTAIILLAMGVLGLAIAGIELRRASYENL